MRNIVTIIAAAFILLSANTANACSDADFTNISDEQYYQMCPHGDAIIENRSDKNDTMDVDCVNWNHKTQMWDTWIMNAKGEKMEMSFSPNEVRVHTMDGELTAEDMEAEKKVSNMLISCVIR